MGDTSVFPRIGGKRLCSCLSCFNISELQCKNMNHLGESLSVSGP